MKTKLGEWFHTWRYSRKTKLISNVRVGKAEVKMDTPAHVPGVAQGNTRGVLKHERGIHYWWRKKATATATRSTGVNAFARNSIVPGAPRLTPP